MRDIFAELSAALADRYRLEVAEDGRPRLLGTGGMAAVYLAFDLRHHRRVALKVLKPELGAALGAERFLREIEIIARLAHPNILPLHDSGDAGGLLYYVMPLVDGASLRDRLAQDKVLPLDQALAIIREVADALRYAHSQGIVHRDIKPENILFQAGHAVVSDFGIARRTDPTRQTRLTETGLAIGTPAYMSPEQATSGEVDGRSDLYALAGVLYEMLSGAPPFEGPTAQAVLARQLTDEVQPLRVTRPEIPDDVDRVIRRALAPSPADRYPTVGHFMEAVESSVSPAASGRWPIRRSRRRTLWWSGAATAAAVALGFGWHAWRAPRTMDQPATLAVFPFRALGSEAGSLGEGVADLLAAAVDGSGGIRVADPSGLWRRLPRDGQIFRPPDLPEAVALSRRISAPTLVLGSVTASGGRLDITARVYSDAGSLRATVKASAPAESLAQAVDRVALDVVGRIWQRESLPTVPVIESFATGSSDAMKAYLSGMMLKRQGRFGAAQEQLEHAVALDSTFALAQMELHSVRSVTLFLNARPITGLEPILDRAMRYRDRLSPRNRLRVEAQKALSVDDGLRAADLLERILTLDSLDAEARQAEAYTYLTLGWQMGKGLDEITAAYDRVLAVDSASLMARSTLVWLGLVREDPDAVPHGLDQLMALDTTQPYIRGLLFALRALDADGSRRDQVLRGAAQEAVPVVVSAFRTLRMARPQLAERLLDELTTDSMPTMLQRIGEGARVQLWFGEGRLHGNDSILASGSLQPIESVVNRFFMLATIAGAGDSALGKQALQRLAPQPPSDAVRMGLDTVRQGPTIAWTAAAYEASLGDTTRAKGWLRILTQLAPKPDEGQQRLALRTDIESRLAVRRGDGDGALAKARQAYTLWGDHSSYSLETHPELATRWQLAGLLRSRGLNSEAEPLYRSLCPPYTWVGFYTALAALTLGEMEEGRRRPNEAAHYYRQAARLWERGEPAVAGPLLARAEEGLRRVGGS